MEWRVDDAQLVSALFFSDAKGASFRMGVAAESGQPRDCSHLYIAKR